MKKLLLTILLAIPFLANAQNQTVVFYQPFSASTTLKDYILSSNTTAGGTSGGPIIDNNSARFDSFGQFYGNLPVNTTYSVDGDGLKITKSTGSVSQATAQIKGLNYGTDVVFAQFDINTSISSAIPSGTPIFFYFGQGYTSNNNSDQNTILYQSLAIFFPTAGNVTPNSDFNIRINGNNSITFQGKQRITWIINRTGNAVNYTGLDNSSQTLNANGDYHVWVGSTKINIAAPAPSNSGTPTMTDFRIRTAGTWTGFLTLDNLAIGYIPTDGSGKVLPVELTQFKAKANASSVNLNWSTANERNASHFNVTRSSDGKTFGKIGEVKAAGKANDYTYTDFSPAKGTNYYQLLEEDFDGKVQKSEVVSAKIATSALEVTVEGTSSEGVILNIFSPKATTAKITLTNLNGQKIAEREMVITDGYNKTTVPTGTYKGLLIATINTPETTISKKTIK